jgi:hypothetical protein
MSDERAQKIAEINDRCRTQFMNVTVGWTHGVAHSGHVNEILAAVRAYDFSKADTGNDPYKERDFGAFEVAGEKYFWKIDYYDADMKFGSTDPTSEEETRRALTIMRADEY